MKKIIFILILVAVIASISYLAFGLDSTETYVTDNKIEENHPAQQTQQTVKLYYYNPELDEDEEGNILCSDQGLVAVDREIPVTQTPIQDTIKLLIRGELTASEVAQGIETEYPLENFALEGANLENGVLTLEFNDPNLSTVGGSCRTGILAFQVIETAKQFEGVESVEFTPEELFQP